MGAKRMGERGRGMPGRGKEHSTEAASDYANYANNANYKNDTNYANDYAKYAKAAGADSCWPHESGPAAKAAAANNAN